MRQRRRRAPLHRYRFKGRLRGRGRVHRGVVAQGEGLGRLRVLAARPARTLARGRGGRTRPRRGEHGRSRLPARRSAPGASAADGGVGPLLLRPGLATVGVPSGSLPATFRLSLFQTADVRAARTTTPARGRGRWCAHERSEPMRGFCVGARAGCLRGRDQAAPEWLVPEPRQADQKHWLTGTQYRCSPCHHRQEDPRSPRS